MLTNKCTYYHISFSWFELLPRFHERNAALFPQTPTPKSVPLSHALAGKYLIIPP